MWRKELREMEDFNKGLMVDIGLKRETANRYLGTSPVSSATFSWY
jgi:hypothetical protein